MKKVSLILTCLVSISLLFFPALQAKVDGDTIVFGSAVSITGKYSVNGKHTKNGYDLAIKRFNERGGVEIKGKKYKLDIIYYDDESTAATAAKLAERLIRQDEIEFVLGPYSSGLTAAMAPITEKYKITMIEANGASSSLFTKGYKYLFALLTVADLYLAPAVDMLVLQAKKDGIRTRDLKAAMAFENDPFSLSVRSGVVAALKKAKIKVVVDEKLPPSLEDMSAILTKVKVFKPNLLVVSGHAKGAATAVRQLKEFNVKVPMLAMTHCDSAAIEKNYPDSAEGTLCARQWSKELTYSDDDKLFGNGLDFVEIFQKEYGYEPPYQAAESAAAVQVWVDALKRSKSFKSKDVRNAVAKTKMQTFYGNVKFDKQGRNIAKPMVLAQIQDGEYKVVSPPDWAQAEFKHPRQ